jgi:hypothetical protein
MEKPMNYRCAVVVTQVVACTTALFSVSGCGSGDVSVEKTAEQSAPLVAQSQEEWRKAMMKAPLPRKGCFQASHPDTGWHEVPCGPPIRLPIRPVRAGVGPGTVGNGTDFSALVTGSMSASEGSFPSVTGVTSESDNGTANSYSLQLNTNFFNTTACMGAAPPPGTTCQGWEQFIYSSTVNATGIYMQFWLVNYGNRCPDNTWTPNNGSCFKNSLPTSVPLQPITNLAHLTLTGSTSSTTDTIVLSTGNGNLTANGSDSVLNLNTNWNIAEFNIFGDLGSTQAKFNDGGAGATIVVKTSVTNGTTASPTCLTGRGTTAETNNLNLVAQSCCPIGGTSPGIVFTETNAAGVEAPFCLLNEITPIQEPLL